MNNDKIHPLDVCANEIYLAIQRADVNGFKVVLGRWGRIDLHDPESGQTTPLITAVELAEGEKVDPTKP